MEEISQDLPSTWVAPSLKDVCEYIQRGKSPKYTDRSELPVINQKCVRWNGVDVEHVKYIHPNQFSQWASERFLQDKDILWNSTGTGTIGRACLYKPVFKKTVVDSHVTIVRTHKDHVLPEYVFYFISSPFVQKKIEDMQSGSTNQVELGKGAIEQTILPLSPINEQKRIVDRIEQLFSNLDEGEALLKTIQKQLATYRQSVLKAAVTGELTKDWREKHKKRLESGEKLLTRILESRRKNWQGRGKHKDVPNIDRSELLELPNGWTWATPEHLVSDAPNSLCIGPFGSNLKVDDYTDAGVPLVFVRHIRAKNFDGLKPQYVSAKKAKELSSHKVIGGDILITKMGEPPGDVCIYPENHPDAIITADCIRFSTQRKFLDTKYLELALNSRPVQTQIQGITKGVAQQKVTLGNFKKVVIPLPGLDEQREIANICDEKFSQIYALEAWCEAELSRSNTLRQSILKSAFSGKLVAQDPADESASELLARIKSGDTPKTKTKAVAPRRGRKPRSDKSETA